MRIKYRIIALALFMLFCMNGWAQTINATGQVLDKNGDPVIGALITVVNNPVVTAVTDQDGKFHILAAVNDQLKIQTSDHSRKIISIIDDNPILVNLNFASEAVDRGFGIHQTVSESTGAISRSTGDQLNERSSFSISNSLFGNALGLTALQKSGPIWDQEPSFNIRGLQTLSSNGILVLVDGMERDLRYITPEEVASVSVLRDAAAVALYGYRGINGVLSIRTKRGEYQTKEVNVSYDHAFNFQQRLPKFADAFTYASAMNEALANDGKPARYTGNELNAFKSGQYPYLYPNVNWIDEVFRDKGSSNQYNVNFRGGGKKMRYFTLFNLQGNQGFIANSETNEGYSTQEKFSKANVRTNLDIDVTSTTSLQVNILGVLSEYSRPGLGSDNLMDKLYTVPSAAFPIKTSDGIWGGNSTWGDYMNPVALTEARGYSKGNTRALYADMKMMQNLDFITKGLSGSLRMGYDNVAAYWEGHNRTYAYASDIVTSWENGEPKDISRYSGGTDSQLGYDSKLDWQDRHMNFIANVDYQHQTGRNSYSTTLIYSYENLVRNGQNNTFYRQNVAAYGHYMYNNRYVADVTLVASGSNKLAPGEKWGISPTVSAAWILSNENFLKNNKFIDFLKLRASWGIINTDNIPTEDYWQQSFVNGGGYSLGGNYDWYDGTMEGRLASTGSTREKAEKSDIGLDMSFLHGFVLTTDAWYEKRKDIWVTAGGANSDILGVSSPYVNGGVVDSWGLEAGLNYTKQLGDLKFDFGGKFTIAKNKIKNELEEPRAYDYLRETGKPVRQIFGLQAIGYFIDQADIDNSPAQQFSEVKPGDIKYKDQNGDGIINEYDKVAMGYNNVVPEIYYSFNLGVEYKRFGIRATFQGVGNYTAILDTKSMYWPLINNTTISENYYKNRWTPATPFAKYPRLTTEDNNNNFQTNSVWLADASFLKLRNCEIYYKLPESVLKKLKMKSAKFYVRGVDLFSLDNIKESDPESVGVAYPMTGSYNVGLVIGF